MGPNLLTITKGPGKAALIGACFYGKKISFAVRNNNSLTEETISDFRIGVQAKGEDDKSWIITMNSRYGILKGYYWTDGSKELGFFNKEKMKK